MAIEKENDLPLLSNINDVSVKHYMFDFSCNFEEKFFTCCAVIILEPVADIENKSSCNCCDHEKNNAHNNSKVNLKNKSKDTFKVILDCHKILVDHVEEINITHTTQAQIKYSGFNPMNFCSCRKLNFSTDKWSLKIWTEMHSCKICFPRFIRIFYRTTCDGSSLLWVTDQDKNPAVFTYGAWINNRSLFPCQEPPSAMATWEATVSVTSPAAVLMSGDEPAVVKLEDGTLSYYYFTRNVLPLSTLCLAIGYWEEHEILSRYKLGPKCRIFSPRSLLDKSVQELFEYAPYCLEIAEDVFGSYPFPRIDFLVVPPTFGSLGMASPNIVFLSQTLLTGGTSMCSRIAHEIAHGWFGLLIGASDWTEEWLSEGFATFVEDHLHVYTVNMSETEARDYIEIKTHIRLSTLLQELSNTNEDLQVLRPSKGETVVQTVDGVDAAILRNGQNPIKAFIQVHYIKGYFLLKHLSNIVGVEFFMLFLKDYIEKYRGKLVTSKDFLVEFFAWFPKVRLKLTIESIYEEWLHNPGIADELKNISVSTSNKLYKKAMKEAQKWNSRNLFYIKSKNNKKKSEIVDFKAENFGALKIVCSLYAATAPQEELIPDQLILLLEKMLEEPQVNHRTLKDMDTFFNFHSANAEVQHRWFELVVKHKYKSKYNGLSQFLTDHLAMGVYLFSEMIFSEDLSLKAIAKERYNALKNEMEPNYVLTIEQMLKDSESMSE